MNRRTIKRRLQFEIANPFCYLFAGIILFDVLFPACAFALGNGPSQPEVQSFEPAETTNMVDPFTGDFTYNIPLLSIDGYPINISYHSGITMDQEASWVGLGWNINPGTVNRSMRGLPDDFRGDVVTKKFNQKTNRTMGASTGVGLEFVGVPTGAKFGLNATVGLRYNNYSGISVEKSINASISSGDNVKLPLNASLGLNSSKENGLTIQPSVGLSKKIKSADASIANLGLKVGTAFNSRAGLKSLSINTSVSNARQINTKSAKASKVISAYATQPIGGAATWDFGMPTYIPQVSLPMENTSLSASLKVGVALALGYPSANVSAYYSAQKLSTNTSSNPAFGYFYADEGAKYNHSLLDFNREKDGPFTQNTPSLPLTNFTYDIYSVTGQGMSGSFRPFRNDVGYVFDPEVSTTSNGGSIGAEIGAGNISHVGVDLTANSSTSRSGKWTSDNGATPYLNFTSAVDASLYEPHYLKEANEKTVDADSSFFQKYGSFDSYRVEIDQPAKFKAKATNFMVSNQGAPKTLVNSNLKQARDRRNELITTISRHDLDSLGLERSPLLYFGAKPHHVAEITSVGAEGQRYVYGIAAYNTLQQEISFATGSNTGDRGTTNNDFNCNTGLVKYAPSENSISNLKGIDNYYSSTETPPYAHSYLLTAVLSPDYLDSDSLRGPSDGDLGTYTKFEYKKIANYKWRTPVQQDSASYSEGLKSITSDDKGNILYGEKELWYLKSINTKNHIAIFHTSNRQDAISVNGVNGGVNTTNTAMQKLDSISLYVKQEYLKNPSTAVPLQRVHFQYDYSLCKNVPNHVTSGQGKLTLKKIYTTYQKSLKGSLSPYSFEYNSINPNYGMKAYDRWGNYKPSPSNACNSFSSNLTNAEYPYVNQNKAEADSLSSAWCLTNITMPTGGSIKVKYESDDYGYVQNKQAMQMFKIASMNLNDTANTTVKGVAFDFNPADDKLYFKLPDPFIEIDKYFEGIEDLYFRFLMRMDKQSASDTTNYEFVSGYAKISAKGKVGNFGWIQLDPVKLKDNGSQVYSPIVKAAIQFGRTYMPRQMYSQPTGNLNENFSFNVGTIKDLVTSSVLGNIEEIVKGPNEYIHTTKQFCRTAMMNKSWIRLNNPSKNKLGGGCRVKRIETSDEWSSMTDSLESSFSYGQEYSYTTEDGKSSGVATYEPQLGGDENVLKQPIFFNKENLLAPDEENYVETPFGESFYPSPSVGYSRVTVTNLQYEKVKRHATGKIVHEFYTAKDFPVITSRTDLETRREKDSPYSLRSILKIDVRDFMTATQGYAIELNDMHGKPKSQKVYQEGINTPISMVEYSYKKTPYLDGSFRLSNNATVIYPNGTYGQAQLGVFYEGVFDAREQETKTKSASLNGNVDITAPGIPVPIIIPSFAKEKTRFRSMTFTKVIQRFALLDETIATDLGSIVSTKNVAYDSETGGVLLTQTKTDFNDEIYSFTYPAHWYYEGMQQAYQNINFMKSGVVFGSTSSATIANAEKYFHPGDELALYAGSTKKRVWVSDVSTNSITVMDKQGNIVAGSYDIKIVRSGLRNMASTPIATLTLLSNPLTNLSGNNFEKILQAGAIEFSDEWKTNCDCFLNGGSQSVFTKNPYVLGTKGNWKPTRSYLHLSGRTQSNYNNNTNIRKDGIFTSFSPFYKLTGGKWDIDGNNWTYTSEVTEFNPYGREVENRDALGRYSSEQYSFNQTFYAATTANSKYRESGFDGFEDYALANCADNHFRFPKDSIVIDTLQAHTGRRSIKVTSGNPAELNRIIADACTAKKCNLEISQADFHTVVSGGTAPYTFDWNITQGNAKIVLGASGTELIISNIQGVNNTVRYIVNVTDAKGCTATKCIELVYNAPNYESTFCSEY
ncbi:MAG: hypothetical protein J0M08_06915 [Bacteroidetes bacterium]|nr:hypothetical protein [Bacteroidota bacterium]